MPINTLYQLLALEGSPLLEAAETLLMIPDLMSYWLTGNRYGELTNASTTQLFGAQSRHWAWELLEAMGVPTRIFPEVLCSGTNLGGLLPQVTEETGLPAGLQVTAVASHDTASAVVAVPAEGERFAYISSGTWSLVGVELPEPIINREAMEANFTNEGGFGGSVRFLKNVMGLWLLQECRRTWARAGHEYGYDELTHLAEGSSTGSFIDPDHPMFLAPGDMPARIRGYCEATGQRPPEGVGEVVRCVLESLALKYRQVVERLESLSGRRIEVIHVVGGGARNALLCRLTALATARTVVAGPAEATAMGNILVQALARGYVGSLEEMRALVRRSAPLQTYLPDDGVDVWQEKYERFENLVAEAPQLARA